MIGKSQGPRGLDPEEEIRKLFQQLPPDPAPVPQDMHSNIQALLLEEVSNTLSASASVSPKPQFPLVGWMQRQVQRLSHFELGPSLTAAAMGAAIVLLFIGFYPYLRSFTTPSARIVVLDSNFATSNDISVLVQSKYGDSLSLSGGDEATLRSGDRLIAWSSSVEIRYADGWTSILRPDSMLDVELLSKTGSEVDIGLYLLDGEIFTDIDRELGYEGHIAIRTDSSLVEAIGTQFVVRTDTKDISYLAVFNGKVQISNDNNSVSATEDQEVLSVTGQELEVNEQPEYPVTVVNPSEPYVTVKDGPVSLHSRPDKSSTSLAWMKESDRLELVGASDDFDWFVVCCVKDNVFSWVNAAVVVPHHRSYSGLRRFSEDAFDAQQDSGINAVTETGPPTASPQGNYDGSAESSVTAAMAEPTTNNALTETIPATSTPVATFTSRSEVSTSPTARPIPPFLKPALPQQIDALVSGAVTVVAAQPVVPTDEATPGGANNGSVDNGNDGSTSNNDSNDTGGGNSGGNSGSNNNDDAPITNQAPATPTTLAGAGEREPEVLSTNTTIPGTSIPGTPTPVELTNTPRPNTATNTPEPPEPTNTLRPNTPRPNTATNTPAPPEPTSTTTQDNGLANTPVPTQVPPTQVPPTQVPPTQVPPTQVPPTNTRRPNTSTPVPPTNTPVIVVPTATAIVPTNTVAPTEKPTSAEPVEPTAVPPTATAQIVPPTAEPATPVSTNTPVPPTVANTPVVVPPTPENTPTPEIVEPTQPPVATATATPNPKLTSPTEPPDQGVPTDPPSTPPPPATTPIPEPPTAAPPAPEPTETPKIVIPTATPEGQDGDTVPDGESGSGSEDSNNSDFDKDEPSSGE